VIRYVETTPEDIELADRLASHLLGRSLDELPPGTRRLLDALHLPVPDPSFPACWVVIGAPGAVSGACASAFPHRASPACSAP
jgi:hypothetical protein